MHGDGSEARWELAVPTPVRALLPLTARELTHTLLLALVYGAAAGASLAWAVVPGVGPVLWPPAGIALAALALGGPKLWPGVFVGQLLAPLALGHGAIGAADLLTAAGASLAAGLPAALLRRYRLDPALTDLRAILWLVLGGGVLGATISTAAALPAMLAAGTPAGLAETLRVWWFGVLAGVLAVAPVPMSWASAWRDWGRFPVGRALHLAAAVGAVAALAWVIFLQPDPKVSRSWYVFPVIIWPALVFSVRGASLAVAAVAVMAFGAAVAHTGPFSAIAGIAGPTVLTQQFIAVLAATKLVLAAVADERRGREQLHRSAERLREESEALEVLNRTGAAIAAELDLDAAVQLVTDAGVSLSGAQFGAFFYNVTDAAGDSYMLFALSGAPRAAFERFGQPRNTDVFAPTFSGQGVVRVDDITRDPRYGRNPPHRGMPKGHLPVRSYLAAPVRSRSGEVIGGLFFGHPEPGVFTERAERLIVGVAAQAAIAIDNGRLYQAAQREIAERTRAEAHQRLLMNELNHRVKNTLATVQSMGAQTLKTGRSLAEAREAFVERLMALSAAHNLLTAERWESADLEDVVRLAVQAFDEPPGARFAIHGPGVRLKASSALGLAMALHELGANATRHGALSDEDGKVDVGWERLPGGRLEFAWRESGGPPVAAPLRRGFGSRLIQEGLRRELRGEVRMDFEPEGLVYVLTFPLDLADSAAESADSETGEESF